MNNPIQQKLRPFARLMTRPVTMPQEMMAWNLPEVVAILLQ